MDISSLTARGVVIAIVLTAISFAANIITLQFVRYKQNGRALEIKDPAAS